MFPAGPPSSRVIVSVYVASAVVPVAGLVIVRVAGVILNEKAGTMTVASTFTPGVRPFALPTTRTVYVRRMAAVPASIVKVAVPVVTALVSGILPVDSRASTRLAAVLPTGVTVASSVTGLANPFRPVTVMVTGADAPRLSSTLPVLAVTVKLGTA